MIYLFSHYILYVSKIAVFFNIRGRLVVCVHHMKCAARFQVSAADHRYFYFNSWHAFDTFSFEIVYAQYIFFFFYIFRRLMFILDIETSIFCLLKKRIRTTHR